MLAIKEGDRSRAVPRLREALREHPDDRDSWVALTRQTPDGERVAYAPSARRVASYPELDVVARSWERLAAGDWIGLSRLDPALADVPPADPLYADALRLRAWWRIELGAPEQAEEALRILEVLLPISRFVPDHVLHVRALQATGQTGPALASLAAMVSRLDASNRHNALFLDDFQTALDGIPKGGIHAEKRARVADSLVARRLEFKSQGSRAPLLR